LDEVAKKKISSEVRTMAGKGRPKAFETAEEFEQKFIKYIEYCKENKRFANIAGFCAYCHIVRDTLYAQKEYYSDTYTIVMDILEDEVLQDNTYRAQLYLKNKFGYKDRQEVESTNTNHNINEDLENLPPEERQKRIDDLMKKLGK
jgi:hypothetical protein